MSLGLKKISLAAKIYLMCGVLVVFNVIVLGYLYVGIASGTTLVGKQSTAVQKQYKLVSTQNNLLIEQRAIVQKRKLIDDILQAFTADRYWLYDLQVSWLNESESKAIAAQGQMTKLLNMLELTEPVATKQLRDNMALFNNKMLEAVDAYVVENRTLGNSIIATARNDGSAIEMQIRKLLDDTSNKVTNLTQQIQDSADQIVVVAQQVQYLANEVKTRNDYLKLAAIFVGALVVFSCCIAAVVLTRLISLPIKKLCETITYIGNYSDLTQRIEVRSADEVGQTALAINAMLEKFQTILQQVSGSIKEISTEAASTTDIMQRTNAGIIKQQKDLEVVATSTNDMAVAVKEIVANTQLAVTAGKESLSEAERGKLVVSASVAVTHESAAEVKQAGEVIHKLSQASNSIGVIIDLIRDISEQTNLLALNAAIEAARAGEAGRGFAVVAEEVRALSNKTKESTQEVQKTIQRLQSWANEAVSVIGDSIHKTDAGVAQANSAAEALDNIIHAIEHIMGLSDKIVVEAHEQAKVTNKINKNIVDISLISKNTLGAANDTVISCTSLTTLAVALKNLIAQFKV